MNQSSKKKRFLPSYQPNSLNNNLAYKMLSNKIKLKLNNTNKKSKISPNK